MGNFCTKETSKHRQSSQDKKSRPVRRIGQTNSAFKQSESRLYESNDAQPKFVHKRLRNDVGSFDTIETIAGLAFFDRFGPEQAKKIKDIFHRQVYEPNTMIVTQGVQASFPYIMYVIVSGRIQISVNDDHGQIIQLKTLDPGQWFSGVAVPEGVSMPISAKAATEVILLAMPVGNLERCIAENPDMALTLTAGNMTVTLKSIPFFENVPLTTLHQLAALFEYRKYRAGKVVYNRGAAADGLYLILSGSIELVADRPDGTEVYLGVLNKPDYFGEICLGSALPIENGSMSSFGLRTITTRTLTDADLLYLSVGDFQTFTKVAPQIVESIAFQGSMKKRLSSSLKAIPFFSDYETKTIGPLQKFDEEGLAILGELFVYANYDAGATVFEQGDEGDAFYLIVHGSVEIVSASDNAEKVSRLATLQENDWFGEISLIMDTKRTATARTLTSCVLLKLTKEKFMKVLDFSPQLNARIRQRLHLRTAEWLKQLPFFAGIVENKPWSKLGLLGSQFRFRECDAGEVVVAEGDRDRTFYIIVSGRVRISVMDEGKPTELDVLKDNQWFGEIALLNDTPRTATVTCIERTLLLYLSIECFERFLDIAPELKQTLSCMIPQRTTNTLRGFPILRNIRENKPWSKLNVLASLMVYKSYLPDTDVIKQGEYGTSLYFIITGKVSVLYQHNDHPIVIDELSNGEIFGEMALLSSLESDSPLHLRCATVRTVEECTLLELSLECFRKFMKMAYEILPDLEVLCNNRSQRLLKTLQTEGVEIPQNQLPVRSPPLKLGEVDLQEATKADDMIL